MTKRVIAKAWAAVIKVKDKDYGKITSFYPCHYAVYGTKKEAKERHPSISGHQLFNFVPCEIVIKEKK
jgi:hypothetical protein